MARVIQLESDEHQAVQSLLPWYVNGTLDDEELARVRAHLAQCARCQADVAWQERLRGPSVATEELMTTADVDRDWAALAARLAPETVSRAPRWQQAMSWLAARWLPAALAVQGALVLVLAFAWLGAPSREEAYHALGGAPSAATANALVVFRPSATESDIRRALRASRAQVVGGPTATDAWLLHMSVLSPEVLSRLRADGAVLRVESLESDPR